MGVQGVSDHFGELEPSCEREGLVLFRDRRSVIGRHHPVPRELSEYACFRRGRGRAAHGVERALEVFVAALALRAQPPHFGEQRICLRSRVCFAGLDESGACVLERLLALIVSPAEQRLGVAEEQLRACRIVGRRRLERPLVEGGRTRVGVERQRSVAGPHKCRSRRFEGGVCSWVPRTRSEVYRFEP
jgi:hypothetical protein